eukprot:CAMPEP_0172482378 /NCGR_PEP_ID=MMETSP1066-20121228/8743_1 /TAXON_ID=671091 /ORGANISM="Coscinodiscus wailesii, Strain CCMP2513" /LENGTH=296 /DNA_ID=CAMNT_0013245435 /DNA_START=50 /DNA_END=940 /DNA_ORIENTATION=+
MSSPEAKSPPIKISVKFPPPPPKASASGLIIFGGLCLGTFGLGCWQTKRHFEKKEMVEKRAHELSLPPVAASQLLDAASSSSSTTTTTGSNNGGNYRRLAMRGEFHHGKQVLIGPRGPPLDALAKTGPMSGRSGGGMGVSPQGYYVITPLVRSDQEGSTVLVNRGWVPRQYIENKTPWSMPPGDVDVVGVVSKMEKPRYLTPRHTLDQIDERKLFWMDRVAIEEASETYDRSPPLITETSLSGDDAQQEFPVKPKAETVGEFTVTPATHAGYAVTWFSLSGAGMFMTRKLLMKGRG